MTTNPWDPAVVVDESLARRLVARAFPDLAEQPFTYVGAGWDNTAWRVGEWVFRFPRRRIARVLMQTEIDVLRPIAGALPLPISAPERVGQPGDDYPYPWAGYRWLEGTTGCRTHSVHTKNNAERLGAFLRALHTLDVHAPLDDWRQLIGGQAKKLRRVLHNISRTALPQADAALTLTEQLATTRCFAGTPVLCHGDLYARHLLFRDGALSGVIDWGDVHLGDPATDLACAIMVFDPPQRDALFDAYGGVSQQTYTRARFRALFSGVFQAQYAHAVGDEALLLAGQRAVWRALTA